MISHPLNKNQKKQNCPTPPPPSPPGRPPKKVRNFTSTSPLLHELVDEHGDSDGVDGLGGDEEVVVVVNDNPEQNQRRHARDHGQEGLHLGRLSPYPCGHGVDRIPLRPHEGFFPGGVDVLVFLASPFKIFREERAEKPRESEGTQIKKVDLDCGWKFFYIFWVADGLDLI